MLKHSKKINTITKIFVAAIILTVPLYPKFPFILVPGTFVSIRLEDFLIFSTMAFWFMANFRQVGTYLSRPVARAMLIFLAASLLSLASSIFVTKTVVFHIGLLHFIRRIEYLGMFFVGITALQSNKALSFYIKCIGVVLIIACIYGYGQKHFELPVITTQNQEYSKGIALRYLPGGHLSSTFAGHYDLATYVVLVSPIFYALIFSDPEQFLNIKRKIKDSEKLLYYGIVLTVIVVGYWLLVNTLSRISILSYVVSVSIVFILLRKIRFIPLFLALAILLSGLSPSLLSRYSSVFNVYFHKFVPAKLMMGPSPAFAQEATLIPLNTPMPSPTSIPEGTEDRSTSIRLNIEWPRALRAFYKNPLFGTGFSSLTLATDNDYLRLLGELGILGIVTFGALLAEVMGGLIKKAVNNKRYSLENAYLVGIIAGVVGVLINAIFIDVFEASKLAITLWLLVGIGFAINTKSEK